MTFEATVRLRGDTVSATAPGDGCAPCTLSLRNDLRAGGQPVAVVVGANGWSYLPDTKALETKVCAEQAATTPRALDGPYRARTEHLGPIDECDDGESSVGLQR